MKKLLTFALLLIATSNYAQISLETTYSTGSCSSGDCLRLIKLSSSGYKYVMNDSSKITLLNLNHTVFKSIPYPSIPGRPTSSRPYVFYVSEELFNTNPIDVEYYISYSDTTYISHAKIFDELGNLLFSKDSATAVFLGSLPSDEENFIAFTTSGAKMILSAIYPDKRSYVYSLPGTLPCHDCTNGTTSSIMTNNSGPNTEKLANYPNPTAGQTTVEYSLPQGVTTADLIFYNMTGQEIKRFKVTNAFHDILISTADLDAGTYYYQLQTADGFKATKKMVVLK